MNVPFLDLNQQMAGIRHEVDLAVGEVLTNSSYILGAQVTAFEEAFANYCGVTHCIGVGSGLDALILSLRALGIGQGDEVILPANTFIASALAITQAGATPVLIDSSNEDFLMDLDQVEKSITEKTRAIMPVHLYGRLADMKRLAEIAAKHNVHIVEDAAQAHGSEADGRRAGSFGIAGCFSFYPGKNLGAAGDAGAITTNNSELADRIRKLRNYGSTIKYQHDLPGVNSRLDSIQAAVLSVKLKYLDAWNSARRERAIWYEEALRSLDLKTPRLHEAAEHVWHLYVVRGSHRDDLIQHLYEHGVMAQIHYPKPLHLQDCYMGTLGNTGDFPVAEAQAAEILSLPLYPELTQGMLNHVAKVLAEFSIDRKSVE